MSDGRWGEQNDWAYEPRSPYKAAGYLEQLFADVDDNKEG